MLVLTPQWRAAWSAAHCFQLGLRDQGCGGFGRCANEHHARPAARHAEVRA